jgi:hypothetical protein
VEPDAEEPARQEGEQRNPTSLRGASRDVTLYSPYTHQWVTFPADSPLVASLPGYWIRVGVLPEGPAYLSAPESENEAEADGEAIELGLAELGNTRCRNRRAAEFGVDLK